MLKDWSLRGKGQDLASLYKTLNDKLAAIEDGSVLVLPPPPIQGIGNAGGFTMQIELRDGSFDLAKLESSAMRWSETRQHAIEHPARLDAVPRQRARSTGSTIDREKVQTLLLTTDSGVLDARELSRLELRRPVQQVRPRLPDLRAGRRALSHEPRRHPAISRFATRTAT